MILQQTLISSYAGLTGSAAFNRYSFDVTMVAEGYSNSFYYRIASDVPTIAAGYSLILDGSSGWAPRDTLDADFSGIHTFSSAEHSLLVAIAAAKESGNDTLAKSIWDTRASNLFSFTISADEHIDGPRLYLPVLSQNTWSIPSDILSALGGSKELAALHSLVWLRPGDCDAEIENAIRAGDRAGAWYGIRYTSIANEGGHYKRHYGESEVFGLYNDASAFTNPSLVGGDEAKNIFQMYAHHREQMRSYDALHGGYTASANTDYVAGGVVAAVHNRQESFNPALQKLLDSYTGIVDSGTKADITEVFVEFTPDSAPTNVLGELETGTYGMNRSSVNGENALFLTGAGDDVVYAGSGNDIIVADGVAADKKQLDGGEGNDWIIGGPGMDNIRGGAGDDHLFGDAGNDMLAADTGTDELTGGAGTDRFEVSKGTTVNDLAADESVTWNGHVLLGAEKKDGVFQDKKGFVYNFTNDQKVEVRSPEGGTVTVLEAAGGPGPQEENELFHVGSIIGRKEKDDDNGDELQKEVEPKYAAAKLNQSSPLVMDLDGDGVELLQLGSANSYFDLDQDGIAERTGWVWSDDGLLARDRNGNGRIDDVGELFGTRTTGGFGDVPALSVAMCRDAVLKGAVCRTR